VKFSQPFSSKIPRKTLSVARTYGVSDRHVEVFVLTKRSSYRFKPSLILLQAMAQCEIHLSKEEKKNGPAICLVSNKGVQNIL